MADHLPILKGRRKSVPLEDLLQVVGVSRQCLCVETEDEDGRVLGSVWIKSGFVLSASAQGHTGREGFSLFLSNPEAVSYSVYRPRQVRAAYSAPLGSLTELILDAAIAFDHRQDAVSAGGPAPAQRASAVETRGVAEIAAPMGAARTEPPSHPRWIVGFASGKGGSGKTTLALNTALAFAEVGQPVLLVDADPLGGLAHSVLLGEARGSIGVYDVLLGRAEAARAILPTRLPGLKILPAGTLRSREGLEHVQRLTSPNAWGELLESLAVDHPLIFVDLPAGLHGFAAGVLGSCTHVLAVLEAEPLALRVLPQLQRALEDQRPREAAAELVGIILNCVQFRSGTSIGVVQGAWASVADGLVLETTVPRDAKILEASEKGVPVAFLDRSTRPPIAGVFRQLADEIAVRIGLATAVAAGEPLRLI
jgi:chromosome partitioning protein